MNRGKRTESLVESQARFHEIQQSLNEQRPAMTTPAMAWVTISRQLGAGGGDIARELGRSLSWRVYDRELIASVAARTAAPESLLRKRARQATSPLDGYLSFFRTASDPGQARFVHELREVIQRIAADGPAIILGRGANCVLGRGAGLRVRVTAPVERRTTRVAERNGIDIEAARSLVTAADAGQRAFIQQAYGADVADPAAYDIVLNTEHIQPSQAVPALVAVITRTDARNSAVPSPR